MTTIRLAPHCIGARLILLALCALAVECAVVHDANAQAPTVCVGDCNGDNQVSVDELVLGVDIALGNQDVSACSAMDSNGDGEVTVDELISAVDFALSECPAAPTATHTSTAEPMATDSATPEPSNTDTPLPSPSETQTPSPSQAPAPTSTPTPNPTTTSTLASTPGAKFCDLPGSVQNTGNGSVVVPGGPVGTANLFFLHIPAGFCAHFFANVPNTRQLRFAPNGDLFVASPTTFTTGGGGGGKAAILVLPDDDHDGTADKQIVFMKNLKSTQGMTFFNNTFYYQDGTRIMQLRYNMGDRSPSSTPSLVENITIFSSTLHWPKAIDVSDDGSIYVANGSDQTEACQDPRPFRGGILKLDGTPGGRPIVKGFRNPISLRCARGHNYCFAVELARDYSADQGGREKVALVHEGDDWGFPCCAADNLPYPDIRPIPDCSSVTPESGSFIIGHTPFDIDFETGKWPAPWDHRAYLPLHGVFGTWVGARVVGIQMDPETGLVLPGSDLTGQSTGAMKDFLTGWDDNTRTHGRPANLAFAPDGRLFLGNDNNGDIIWIAPLGL
ncbi:MAG TPA: hypothetical protein VMT89_07480 [Candidatus Acidoferrales bacterium]|nr:hypothetical protein [Candidatus Acidoferrales bacterium]